MNTTIKIGAYFAHNIGFGLPGGRFFKIEITPKHGQLIYCKVGGCYFESEAKDFAVKEYASEIAAQGGFQGIRIRECGQFEAVLYSPRPTSLLNKP